MNYLLNEDICPSITREILNKLIEIKVIFVNDLISSDLSKLKTICRTNQIDFKTLNDIKRQLYSRFGPKKFNSYEMFHKEILLSDCDRLFTGIQKLDQMLTNGIRRGEVLEVLGYSGCGKSQFCLTFAIKLLVDCQKPIVYLSTDLSFSYLRFKNILQNRFSVIDNSENERILSQMKVFDVFDIRSLLNTIDSIDYDLETNPNSKFKDIQLLIVDSLSAPLSHELKNNIYKASVEEKTNQKQKAIKRKQQSIALIPQIRDLLDVFASKHSMSVIVVNSQMVSLKNNWKNWQKLCLHFETIPNEGVFTKLIEIKVIRNYDKFEDLKSDHFDICSKGID